MNTLQKSKQYEHNEMAENKWVNLDERLPPQDVYVLVSMYDGRKGVEMEHVEIAARLGNNWINPQDGEVINMKSEVVTHWMPIPDTPGKNV